MVCESPRYCANRTTQLSLYDVILTKQTLTAIHHVFLFAQQDCMGVPHYMIDCLDS